MPQIRIPLTRPSIGPVEAKVVSKVINSTWIREGPRTLAAERMLAGIVHAEHAIMFSSCTVALETALRAAGIGPKQDVIIPDFTHPATAYAALNTGASVRLVDVDPSTWVIDWRVVSKPVGSGISAVLPVSIFGMPAVPLDEVSEVYGLWFIEDAACSLGARVGKRRVGSIANITCFSFHSRKLVTCGEGGAVTTNIQSVNEFCRSYKQFGDNGRLPGGSNFKISDINSAMLVPQFSRVASMVNERRRLVAAYMDALDISPDSVQNEGVTYHSYQTFAVRVPSRHRSRIMRTMAEAGIETQVGSYALHKVPGIRDHPRVSLVGRLSNSSDLSRSLLALPLYNGMTDAEQEKVVSAFNAVIATCR